MKTLEFKAGDLVKFEDEVLPYTVMASGPRFAILSRKIHKKHDRPLLADMVENDGFHSTQSAWEHFKDDCVYTLLDFEAGVRGRDNYVFGVYDYALPEDCEKALRGLEAGEFEISRRSYTPFSIESVTPATT